MYAKNDFSRIMRNRSRIQQPGGMVPLPSPISPIAPPKVKSGEVPVTPTVRWSGRWKPESVKATRNMGLLADDAGEIPLIAPRPGYDVDFTPLDVPAPGAGNVGPQPYGSQGGGVTPYVPVQAQAQGASGWWEGLWNSLSRGITTSATTVATARLAQATARNVPPGYTSTLRNQAIIAGIDNSTLMLAGVGLVAAYLLLKR